MKRLLLLVLISLFCVMALGSTLAGADEEADQSMQVELTDKQIKELSKLHQDIFKRKKKLITKYVEYGILSKEKGERIIQHMEKHLEYVKEHGYLPMKHKHCGHHHHHDGEKDER